MDYTSASMYETVDLMLELKNLEDQNKNLIKMLNDEKAKIDMDVALGLINAVTAFMRYKTLEVKGVRLKKDLNNGVVSEMVFTEEEK